MLKGFNLFGRSNCGSVKQSFSIWSFLEIIVTYVIRKPEFVICKQSGQPLCYSLYGKYGIPTRYMQTFNNLSSPFVSEQTVF